MVSAFVARHLLWMKTERKRETVSEMSSEGMGRWERRKTRDANEILEAPFPFPARYHASARRRECGFDSFRPPC